MKPQYLFIVEKPSLKRAVEEVYQKIKGELPYEATFVNARGHVVRFAKPNEYKGAQVEEGNKFSLPVPWVPDVFEMKLVEENLSYYKTIKMAYQSKKWDAIVNTCDPEREGQLIFYLIRTYLKMKEPAKRYWMNDLTEESIIFGLKHLRDNDSNEKMFQEDAMLLNLTHAAILRAHNDLLCGMNFSSALGIAVGRVRTPTLAMVVRRDLEIENFVEKVDYELTDVFTNGLEATLLKEGEESSYRRFETEEQVETFAYQNLSEEARVKTYETEIVTHRAPSLYKLSQLQTDANKTLGMGADKVLEVCQSLYEKGILSYPRTGCSCISSSLLKQARELLKSASNIPELKPYIDNINPEAFERVANSKAYVNDKEISESGHSALVPTVNAPSFDSLSSDEKAILTMVCKRFVAIFMEPEKELKNTLILENNGFLFRVTGASTQEKGYKALYSDNKKENAIPLMREGDVMTVKSHVAKQKKTTPPARFTDGTLIEAMENPLKYLADDSYKDILKDANGIGTDATRTSILKNLEATRQIEHVKGKGKSEHIVSTPLGRKIIHDLEGQDIISVELTGEWEQKLSDVATGKLEYREYEKDMVEYVSSETIKYSQIKGSFRVENTPVGDCPFCKGENSIKKGPYGFYCTDKTCKFSVKKENLQWLKETFNIPLTEKHVVMILQKGHIKTSTGHRIGFKMNEKGFCAWDIQKNGSAQTGATKKGMKVNKSGSKKPVPAKEKGLDIDAAIRKMLGK